MVDDLRPLQDRLEGIPTRQVESHEVDPLGRQARARDAVSPDTHHPLTFPGQLPGENPAEEAGRHEIAQ